MGENRITMNELFFYNLLQSIIDRSLTFQGRFAVIKGTSDVNEANFGELVRDALGGLVSDRKYPGVVLLPPQEIVNRSSRGWSTFKLSLFFCTLDGRDGSGDIAEQDFGTNLSLRSVVEDWNKMRNCAGDLRTVFTQIISRPGYFTTLRPNNENADIYDRFSWAQNDKINGVRLTFDIDMALPCEQVDYPVDIIMQLTA